MKRSELFKLRELIERASAMLPDEEAAEGPALFPAWAVGKSYLDRQQRVGARRLRVE